MASATVNCMSGLGPNGEIYRPVIVTSTQFKPEADAEQLEKAMKGVGTDEKALINILCRRTALERGEIARTYKAMYGKDLIKQIKSETSGNFGKAMRYLCLDAPTLRAKIVYDCIAGLGTDELGLIEILCSATNTEIEEIKEAYKKVLDYKGKNSSRTLEKDIVDDTSGLFRRVLVAIVQGERKEPDMATFERAKKEGIECLIDLARAKESATKLYNAGEGKIGTDESMFIQVLGHESVWQLAAIDQAYMQISKRSLREAIKSEMSGNLATSLSCILDFALDRPAAFATRLYKSMKGLGTNDDSLIRIMVTRADVDMMEIKEAYAKQYGRNLADDIRGDTSGDYKNAMLTLCGEV